MILHDGGYELEEYSLTHFLKIVNPDYVLHKSHLVSLNAFRDNFDYGLNTKIRIVRNGG